MTGRVLAWPSIPLLGLRRRWAIVGWTMWLSVTAVCLVTSVATFARFLGSGGDPLVVGPLAMNPALSDELLRLFGSDGPIRLGQSVVHVVGFVIYAGTGLFIVARRPSTWMPLLGSAMLILVGTSLFAPLATLEGTEWEGAAELIGTLSPTAMGSYWTSLAGLSVVAFFLLFPDRRWVPAWAVWGLSALAAVGVASLAVPDIAASWWSESAGMIWGIAVPFALIAAQVYRQAIDPGDGSRRARPVVVSFGFVIVVFTVIWAISPELSSDAFGLILATPRLVAVYDVNLLILLTLAVFVFPISIWVAIARYRLFDIELIVNRALVYGTITGLVTLGVLAVGAVLAIVFGVGSERSPSPAEAAIVGAAMGASFIATIRPLRTRVQRGVDRRFYPEKYAVDRAIEAFAARTEDVVELEELVDGVRTVIEDGFHPGRLAVWHPVSSALSLEPAEAEVLLARGESVTLSSESGPLRRLHDDGYLVAVPFVSQGRLAGAALIGSRRAGSYSALDLELLDRLAHRVAPALRLGELVRRQEQDATERQRLAGEMEAARRIQIELLPKELPRLGGWVVDAFYRPAREVGGDFYDFIPLGDGRIVVVVGDVTGKGIPAAMVMTTCRTLLRGATGDDEGSPGRVLAQVNDLLRSNIPAGMFVTCLLGILEGSSGSFLFANAGHDLPYLKRGAEASEVRATGMPLGLLPEMSYEEVEVTLQPGDTLLLSTDGLVEVHAPDGDMLGFPRFGAMVAAAEDELALIPSLLEAQRAFTGPHWDQEDDITLLMFHRRRASAQRPPVADG